MDISSRFIEILKSINYHVGHLPRDLFANEEQLPELLPIFTWFNNNVTTKSNCITPKELALYDSISSKYDNSSLDKLSSAINKFYDKTTKDSKVCSSDLETLEKKILKSQQELNDLKAHGTLYEKKNCLLDDEIDLLKQKEKNISKACCKTENNLDTTMKTFSEKIDAFGTNINKLHHHVTKSMKNDDECLTILASKNLTDLTYLWREQIFKMMDKWFKKENSSSMENDTNISKKIHTLSLLSQSVAAIMIAENNEKCNIAKLNIAINDTLGMINYYNDHDSNGFDISNYITKNIKHREIPIENQHSTDYDNLKTCISKFVVSDAEKKLIELETINSRITFIQDSIEHYIMMCDVLWCLMRTACSMANFKCELVNHCNNVLKQMLDDIMFSKQWISDYINTNPVINTKNVNSSSIRSIVKFNDCKIYSSLYDNDETEKLMKKAQEWKSKYHFSRDECNKLAILQRKLLIYSNTLKDLSRKYCSSM